MANKLKIINDPVHGFIKIPYEIIFDIMEHHCFQRLRRISQTGLLSLIFPGATHTRFHHAIGAMHLMFNALEILKQKGVKISTEEEKGAMLAVLLHDVGHGPFSHALENILMDNWHHEKLSLLLMEQLNEEFSGELTIAIQMFQGKYHRKFFNQLISSQLDVDRLDYLKRDSFYTGVSEGNINTQRILSTLNVLDDELVLDEKGIYSIEEFLVARRLMYWQVYLHKTSIGAEFLLIKVLERVKELYKEGKHLPMTPALEFFVQNHITKELFDSKALQLFAQLDDYDIISGLKQWQYSDDKVLSNLSYRLLNRDLLRVKLYKTPVTEKEVQSLLQKVAKQYDIPLSLAHYFVFTGEISNTAYRKDEQNIFIHTKENQVVDVTIASDQMNLDALATKVTKYYLCSPK